MAIAIPRHRFTVDEYYKMAETGILAPRQRVELIEGEVVDMTPIGRRHMACLDRLAELFFSALLGRAIIRTQGALRLGEHSEPQPDLVILKRRADYYADVDAGPDDALLVVEVADTSEHYDRLTKVPLYARAGIPELWLVDINAMTVTVYRQPRADGYADVRVYASDEPLSPLAFPDLVLTPARILG
jgi:Uma2 family endonuclease